MKYAILFLMPFLAQANTVDSVYKANSELPLELKQRVLAQVEAKCAAGVIQNGLSEVSTTVREESIDQGIRDYFYTTTFRSAYFFDGMHLADAYITVTSAEYQISNPSVDRFEIQSVSSDVAELCK